MLEIKDLTFSFDDHVIYNSINMTFQRGMVTGIVGANGVGKTTLFRIISGMYKPIKGTVEYNNTKLKPTDVAFMVTEPYFYPYMKGQEYIDIVTSTPQEIEKAQKYAEMLQLPLQELVDNYSTGMKKKLTFSSLFPSEKPVIILDEPYNGVDLVGNEMIKHILKTQRQDRIILLSSHILHTLTDICDCILHIRGNSEIIPYDKTEFKILESLLMEDILLIGNKD